MTSRRVIPSETVECPICFAKPEHVCLAPSGSLAGYSHQARVMLAILGNQSREAVMRVHKLVEQYHQHQRVASAKRKHGWPVDRLLKEQKESTSFDVLSPDDVEEG